MFHTCDGGQGSSPLQPRKRRGEEREASSEVAGKDDAPSAWLTGPTFARPLRGRPVAWHSLRLGPGVRTWVAYVVSTLALCLCVCVCVCLCMGKTILKRGAAWVQGPQRSPEAPAYKTSGAVLTAYVLVSGACSGRGRGPRVSPNLWGWGLMSPPSLLFHAVQRSATVCASSWLGGGGGRVHPPSLVGPFPCEAWWPSLLVAAPLCGWCAPCPRGTRCRSTCPTTQT